MKIGDSGVLDSPFRKGGRTYRPFSRLAARAACMHGLLTPQLQGPKGPIFMTLAASCKKYFGLREGQTLRGFSAELKDLTYDDKIEIALLLNEEGHPTDLPLPSSP